MVVGLLPQGQLVVQRGPGDVAVPADRALLFFLSTAATAFFLRSRSQALAMGGL